MVYYRRESDLLRNPKLRTKNTISVKGQGLQGEGEAMNKILKEKKQNGVVITKLTAFWFSTDEDINSILH